MRVTLVLWSCRVSLTSLDSCSCLPIEAPWVLSACCRESGSTGSVLKPDCSVTFLVSSGAKITLPESSPQTHDYVQNTTLQRQIKFKVKLRLHFQSNFERLHFVFSRNNIFILPYVHLINSFFVEQQKLAENSHDIVWYGQKYWRCIWYWKMLKTFITTVFKLFKNVLLYMLGMPGATWERWAVRVPWPHMWTRLRKWHRRYMTDLLN